MKKTIEILKQIQQAQEKQAKLEIQQPTKEELEYYKVNKYQKDGNKAQIEETCNIKDMWRQQTPKHNNNHNKGR
ncbi:hypothetical protein [Candidatus Deianiraea vastatrix]|uniref:Uncharacterized protein n=1 Tax=Candidatus Deianiraea vastatrix TaxID=2163644 RepID=A0A5B8XD27_9RICK|nr:hypothetical protein [Candidatus Deianiraea vastatrix]QED22926.1 hypothetical protein Deia_00114 [Candidatus Deianiraea vastatrix]